RDPQEGALARGSRPARLRRGRFLRLEDVLRRLRVRPRRRAARAGRRRKRLELEVRCRDSRQRRARGRRRRHGRSTALGPAAALTRELLLFRALQRIEKQAQGVPFGGGTSGVEVVIGVKQGLPSSARARSSRFCRLFSKHGTGVRVSWKKSLSGT